MLQDVGVVVDRNEDGNENSNEHPIRTNLMGRFATSLPYGPWRLMLNVPNRYQRFGLFSRDWMVRVYSSAGAAHLFIGLPARKR
jgi:hypothetical protein